MNITPAEERISLAVEDIDAIRSDLLRIRARIPDSPAMAQIAKIEKRLDDVVELLERGY